MSWLPFYPRRPVHHFADGADLSDYGTLPRPPGKPQALSSGISRKVEKAPPHVRAGLDAYRAALNKRKDWHETADHTRCQAASQRSDGECWWRYCPARDGACPLPQKEFDDEP